MENITKLNDCKFSLLQTYIGERCNEDNAILTKAGMVYFCNNNINELFKDVVFAYKNFQILDEKGDNMLYDEFDPQLLLSHWKSNDR